MSDTVADAKNVYLFIKEETTQGVPAWPDATDTVLVTSDPTFKQERAFINDKQKRQTRGETKRFVGPWKPGEFSFGTYVLPSGSLGVAPRPNLALKGVFGNETVTPSTSVEYTLSGIGVPIPTFSILIKNGPMVKMCTGCAFDSGSFPVNPGDEDDESIAGVTFSGPFLRHYRAGTDSLNSAIDGSVTAVTAIPLKKTNGYKSYSVGAKIFVGTNDNSGSGFEITAIDEGANTLTIADGVNDSQVDGAAVAGWTPTVTETGYPVHWRFGVYQESLDGGSTYGDVIINGATVTIKNGVVVDKNSKTGSGFPARLYFTGNRTIEYPYEKLYTDNDTGDDYDAENQVSRDVKLPAGDTAGYRFRFEMPRVEIDTPEVSGDDVRTQNKTGHPFETVALNDSIKMIFD